MRFPRRMPLPALLVLVACDTFTEPDSVMRVGVLTTFSEPIDAVAVGNAIRVDVTTAGNACVSNGRDHVEVDREGRTIRITPYDRQGLGPCFDIGIEILHSVVVRPGDGEWNVDVYARQLRLDVPADPYNDPPVAVIPVGTFRVYER